MPDDAIVIRSAADWAALPPHDDRDYRRGYTHGYSQAVDDFLSLMRDKGYSRAKEAWNILAAHFDDALTPWRYGQPHSGMPMPPCLRQRSWKDIRREVFERDGEVCSLCQSRDDLEIDHVVPVREGGWANLGNLRVICQTCNTGRNVGMKVRRG